MRGALTWLCGAALLACASTATQPASSDEHAALPPPIARSDEAPPTCGTTAGICFSVVPSEAEITVNGASKGRVSEQAHGFLALAPGIYQITLTAPGCRTWRAEVAVKEMGEPLVVELEKRDDSAP